MVNYLYDKVSFIVQVGAHRYEEFGGTDIPYGSNLKKILMGESQINITPNVSERLVK